MIPLCYPNIYKRDWLKALEKVFATRWIGQADKVDEFERLFANRFEYNYVLMLNSGTSALELAYHLIGIDEGDEVITPVLTCTATNIPLLRRKAKLVFSDISDNLTPSYEDIKKKITEHTKAIVVVSLGGIEPDKRIFQLAKEKGIPVVHDAAQYLEHTEGDYICYSLQAIKHITCGDGGVLVTKTIDDYKRAKKLRWFGIDREKKMENDWQSYKHREMTFDIEEAGYKYQPTDIDAAIAIASLEHYDEIMAHYGMLKEIYEEEIKQPLIIGSWLAGGLFEYRDELAEYLKENGVETNMMHLRNDIFKIFGGKRLDLPNMNKHEDKYLYFPLNNKVSQEDAEYIAKKINHFYENCLFNA